MASPPETPTTLSPPSRSGFGNQATYKVKGPGWLRQNIREVLALIVVLVCLGNMTAAIIVWAVAGKEFPGLSLISNLLMLIISAYFTVEHKTPAQHDAEIKKG